MNLSRKKKIPNCTSDEMKSDNNNMAELLRFEKSLTLTNKITLTKSIPVGAASVELSDFDFNVLEEPLFIGKQFEKLVKASSNFAIKDLKS